MSASAIAVMNIEVDDAPVRGSVPAATLAVPPASVPATLENGLTVVPSAPNDAVVVAPPPECRAVVEVVPRVPWVVTVTGFVVDVLGASVVEVVGGSVVVSGTVDVVASEVVVSVVDVVAASVVDVVAPGTVDVVAVEDVVVSPGRVVPVGAVVDVVDAPGEVVAVVDVGAALVPGVVVVVPPAIASGSFNARNA